jgi:hypothetical protein
MPILFILLLLILLSEDPKPQYVIPPCKLVQTQQIEKRDLYSLTPEPQQIRLDKQCGPKLYETIIVVESCN